MPGNGTKRSSHSKIDLIERLLVEIEVNRYKEN